VQVPKERFDEVRSRAQQKTSANVKTGVVQEHLEQRNETVMLCDHLRSTPRKWLLGTSHLVAMLYVIQSSQLHKSLLGRRRQLLTGGSSPRCGFSAQHQRWSTNKSRMFLRLHAVLLPYHYLCTRVHATSYHTTPFSE